MKVHRSISIKLLLLLTVIVQTSNAEVTVIQQEVLDNYMSMKNMSSQQRKEFRAQIFAGKSRQETKAYTQAYKQVRGMLPDYLGVTNKTDPAKVGKQPTKTNKSANRTPGSSITYDTGTVFGTTGIASEMLGNRFDTALNTSGTMCCFPVETSGSITMITFNMANTFFSSAVWSLYSNVSGTTAMQVTSMGRGIMTGLNTLSVMSPTSANAYMNGAFLAGIFQFMPASTGLAVDSGTLGGQGFHAININDGTTGTMLTNVTTGGGGGLNAIFRVSGNVATPVELINFTIE
ncbi:MAG: hypothetical protein JKY19_03090 [Alcanivoracaceae bacterium]|nr:hypothetical protein [Alcanivoracaceae bacterium]